MGGLNALLVMHAFPFFYEGFKVSPCALWIQWSPRSKFDGDARIADDFAHRAYVPGMAMLEQVRPAGAESGGNVKHNCGREHAAHCDIFFADNFEQAGTVYGHDTLKDKLIELFGFPR
jgi:hypothetical protein